MLQHVGETEGETNIYLLTSLNYIVTDHACHCHSEDLCLSHYSGTDKRWVQRHSCQMEKPACCFTV